jgi:hypothetical protein
LAHVLGAGGGDDPAGLEAAIGLGAIHRAQAGCIADMDLAADALYGRVRAPA